MSHGMLWHQTESGDTLHVGVSCAAINFRRHFLLITRNADANDDLRLMLMLPSPLILLWPSLQL